MAEENMEHANIAGTNTDPGSNSAPAPAPQVVQQPNQQNTPAATAAGVPVSAPQPTPAQDIAAVHPSGDMKTDVAKILADTKLPERKTETAKLIAAPVEVIPPTPQIETMAQAKPAPPEKISTVHTLQGDMKNTVQTENISMVRAAALESDRPARPERIVPSAQRAHYGGIIFAIVILLFLGTAAFVGVALVQNNRTGTTAPISTSLMFSENSYSLPVANLSSSALKQQLAKIREGTGGSLGSIVRIVPTLSDETNTPREATLPEFFTAIGAAPPDSLVRALGTNFFLGFHTVDKVAPVMVIPVVSYDQAFAGMLSWEPVTDRDLAPFFTTVSDTTVGEGGVPTRRLFSDSVLRNYDIRVLKDDSGNIVLYYSFPSRSILIIAESPYTFAETLSRLQADRRL